MADFSLTSYPTARRQHRCVECCCDILPGTRYARWAGATDGRGWSERLCLDCHALTVEVWDVLVGDDPRPDLGPTFGGLWAWLEEDDDHERLSPEGRARFERLRAAVAAWNARIAAEKAGAAL